MPKKKRPTQQSQPTASFSIEIARERLHEPYKTPVELEHNKLGNRRRFRQLIFEEVKLDAEELDKALDAVGLNLTLDQERALNAVQRIMEKHDYIGNKGPDKFLVSKVDYLYAFGLEQRLDKKGHKKGFYPAEEQRALEALRSLARKSFTLVLSRWDKRSQKYKGYRDTGSLIHLTEEAEQSEWDAGEWEQFETLQPEEKVSYALKMLTITCSHALFKGIPRAGSNERSYYALRSALLHDEVKLWYMKERKKERATTFPKEPERFIGSYLSTINKREMKIRESTLLYKLKMESLRHERGKQAALDRLNEVMRCAFDLGYLEDWEIRYEGLSPEPIYWMRLNPEKCSRVKVKKSE